MLTLEEISQDANLVNAIDWEMTPEEAAKYATEKEADYNKELANPYQAARYGFIDDVIEPRNTRFRVSRAFQTLINKKEINPPKKHSNIPL